MEASILVAKKRDLVGKKVKKLRREGFVPASIFGKDVKSTSVSVPQKEFLKIYSKVGATGLIELKYDGTSQHTLVANVQIHPVTRAPLHVEFHAVKLTERITADVPLELVGESPAVKNNTGLLLQTINEVQVEALPADLPEKITVDTSKLANVDEQIAVGELSVPKGVTIFTKSEEIVVKVVSAISEETKKEMEAEAAVAAAKAPEPAAETPAPETTESKPPAS